jgi:WD40 repeat protein
MPKATQVVASLAAILLAIVIGSIPILRGVPSWGIPPLLEEWLGVPSIQAVDISRDDRHIVLSAGNTRAHALYRMRSDGTGLRRLTRALLRTHESPIFSPDGTRIAFVSRPVRQNAYGKYGDLYIMNADGANLRCLTCGREIRNVLTTAFSHDGQNLYFIHAKRFDSWFELYRHPWDITLAVVNVETGTVRELLTAAATFPSAGGPLALGANTLQLTADGQGLIVTLEPCGEQTTGACLLSIGSLSTGNALKATTPLGETVRIPRGLWPVGIRDDVPSVVLPAGEFSPDLRFWVASTGGQAVLPTDKIEPETQAIDVYLFDRAQGTVRNVTRRGFHAKYPFDVRMLEPHFFHTSPSILIVSRATGEFWRTDFAGTELRPLFQFPFKAKPD